MPFEKFEILESCAYRFIGSSVYIGNKAPGTHPESNKRMFDIHGSLWNLNGWVFEKLDELKEYDPGEARRAALFTWEKYDDKNQLYGYYIGRFMAAETPVPNGMDYFDIDGGFIAKAWNKGKFGGILGNCLIYGEDECKNEIELTGLYDQRGWVWTAEVYETGESGESCIGIFIPCVKK